MKSSGMFTLTAIGSCRIVSPVKRAQPYFNFQANFKRIYGFTHTSSEALQQIRFILGLIDIPEKVRPFIFRPNVNYSNTDVHSRSDFYIIEISSQKKIMAYGFCLQINYLTRHFYEFLAKQSGRACTGRWPRKEIDTNCWPISKTIPVLPECRKTIVPY